MKKLPETSLGSAGHMLGELVISFKDGTSKKEIDDFLAARGFTRLSGPITSKKYYIIKVPVGQENALVPKLKTDPLVRTAELNGVHTLAGD